MNEIENITAPLVPVLAKLQIAAITLDAGTQSRTGINSAAVEEYAEALRGGALLPNVVVVDDGDKIYLADGFHRVAAHKAAELTEIDCEIRFGTRRDAVLFSAGANATHGLRRTNEDKRKSVRILLADEEWSKFSDREIARLCRVSNNFVGEVRRAICHPMTDAPSARVVTRNGTTFEQNTANIGKTAPTPVPAAEPKGLSENTPDFSALLGGAPGGAEEHPLVGGKLTLEGDLDDMVDDTPDFIELLHLEEAKVRALTDQVAALNSRIKFLGDGDQVARIEELAMDRDSMHSLAITRFNDLAEANNTIIKYKRLLDKLRKAAGVEKYSDILPCITRISQGA